MSLVNILSLYLLSLEMRQSSSNIFGIFCAIMVDKNTLIAIRESLMRNTTFSCRTLSAVNFYRVCQRECGLNEATQSKVCVIYHVMTLCCVTVPPRWKIEPRDSSVVLGHNIVIDCQSEGDPAPVVTWKKGECMAAANFMFDIRMKILTIG